MIKVEPGKPIPPRSQGKAKYPWRQMNVGDSFDVPVLSHEGASDRQRSILSCGRQFAIKHDTKYTGRIIRDDDSVVIRVWRIE